MLFDLLITVAHIKGASTHTESYYTTQPNLISLTGTLSNDAPYKITINAVPDFLIHRGKTKKSNEYLLVLFLNTKLLRYATKKDPLIIWLKDVKYIYQS